MNLKQLKILDSAARHLNLTNAAAEMHMSQPAVSMQLKRLEQEFKLQLYETSNRGVKLTRIGRSFIDAVRPLLADIDKIDAKFKSGHPSKQSNQLTVGGNHTLSVTVLLEVLIEFRKRYKDLQLSVETDSSLRIEEQVLNSEIDIALISTPTYFPSCAYEVYDEQETMAFVPPDDHRGGTTMDLEMLTQQPLVSRKGSVCIEELRKRGYQPNLTLQFIAPDAVKAAVLKGLGIGLLFKSRIEPEIKNGNFKMIDVSELKDLTQKSFIMYRKDRPLTPVAQDFLATLRNMKPSALP
jgi:DNA-binding transcriptional LysR family regulator